MDVRIDHRPEPARKCHKSGEKNADNNERAEKMSKVPEVGVQRAQNDCNTGHAQRREAGAEADCETRKYRRGNFCPSFTTKQGNCFHEYEGRYDRSYEGCKEAEYDRETEAE